MPTRSETSWTVVPLAGGDSDIGLGGDRNAGATEVVGVIQTADDVEPVFGSKALDKLPHSTVTDE